MNIKHQLWMLFGRSNIFYQIFYFLDRRYGGIETTKKGCDLVIEGYPRCANTFAYVAFKLMQEEKFPNLMIAHHIHGPMQIIRGVEYDIPTVLLLRNPTDAVVSLLIRDDSIRPQDAFRNYIKFHQKLIKYRNKLVIADFELIINNFGKVVEEVNKKYGKSFTLLKVDDSFLEKCKDEVMEMDKKDTGKEKVDKTKVGVPSKERIALKNKLRTRISAFVDEDLIYSAKQIYAQFKEMSLS